MSESIVWVEVDYETALEFTNDTDRFVAGQANGPGVPSQISGLFVSCLRGAYAFGSPLGEAWTRQQLGLTVEAVTVPKPAVPVRVFKDIVCGALIEGFERTETQDGKACGYILVNFHARWVTAWYRAGDTSWSLGHYHDGEELAREDMAKRVRK